VSTIAVTGATGFIGLALVRALVERGDRVLALVRDAGRARAILPAGVEAIEAGLESPGPWQARLVEGVDGIVHLAGEPIAAKRWDARQKQLIRDSRVESTRAIVDAIRAAPPAARPRVLVSASGADYYDAVEPGEFDDEDFGEDQSAGDSFLARVCAAWEAEAVAAEPLGVRVVRLRTGVVLGRGGALDRMRTPFKMFVGGKIGSGKQWFSWVHLTDAVGAYLFALDNHALGGPANLVAPGAARARDLARAMGRALGRPAWLPVPGFALHAAVGEFAEYLLTGRKVVPKALLARGFTFAMPSLDAAVADALA
jgi:hypothetical protein